MLEELRRRTDRSGLEIILINVWEAANARQEAELFCQIWGVDGPVLLDEDAEFIRLLGIRGVPTNVLVDERGIVRAVGVTRPHELHAAVDALLAREG